MKHEELSFRLLSAVIIAGVLLAVFSPAETAHAPLAAPAPVAHE